MNGGSFFRAPECRGSVPFCSQEQEGEGALLRSSDSFFAPAEQERLYFSTRGKVPNAAFRPRHGMRRVEGTLGESKDSLSLVGAKAPPSKGVAKLPCFVATPDPSPYHLCGAETGTRIAASSRGVRRLPDFSCGLLVPPGGSRYPAYARWRVE